MTDEDGVTHREGPIGCPMAACGAIMTARWSLKPRAITCLNCAA